MTDHDRSMNISFVEAGIKALILIPAYNESQRILPVISEAGKFYDVLVINDGSTDNTAEIAQKAGAQVIHQVPNQGKGSALRMGFQHALESGYQVAITIDADGQHKPSDIPQFIDTYNQNQADLIIGARDFTRIPIIRRIANSLGRITFSWAVGQYIPDNQSGYRLISRRLMNELLASKETGFKFEVEMIKICIKHNYSLEWVSIQTIYEGETSHISPINHIRNFLSLVLQTRLEMKKG